MRTNKIKRTVGHLTVSLILSALASRIDANPIAEAHVATPIAAEAEDDDLTPQGAIELKPSLDLYDLEDYQVELAQVTEHPCNGPHVENWPGSPLGYSITTYGRGGMSVGGQCQQESRSKGEDTLMGVLFNHGLVRYGTELNGFHDFRVIEDSRLWRYTRGLGWQIYGDDRNARYRVVRRMRHEQDMTNLREENCQTDLDAEANPHPAFSSSFSDRFEQVVCPDNAHRESLDKLYPNMVGLPYPKTDWEKERWDGKLIVVNKKLAVTVSYTDYCQPGPRYNACTPTQAVAPVCKRWGYVGFGSPAIFLTEAEACAKSLRK